MNDSVFFLPSDLISKQASSAVNQEKSLERVRPKAVAEFLKVRVSELVFM